MNTVEITRQRQRLENLFRRAEEFSEDPELMSHWARYLCVLTSGFLEISVRLIYGSYAQEKATPQVANFVQSQLKTFQNPKMEKILELTRFFSPEWETALRVATDGEPKDAVDSIVANRHSIAHGQAVGLSLVQIRRYFRGAVRVIEMLEDQCSD